MRGVDAFPGRGGSNPTLGAPLTQRWTLEEIMALAAFAECADGGIRIRAHEAF